jgi:hypothetical protein
LSDLLFTEFVAGVASTTAVAPGRPYLQVLKGRFGLEVDAAYEDLGEIAGN